MQKRSTNLTQELVRPIFVFLDIAENFHSKANYPQVEYIKIGIFPPHQQKKIAIKITGNFVQTIYSKIHILIYKKKKKYLRLHKFVTLAVPNL